MTTRSPIACPPSKDYDDASRAQAIAANPAHPAWVSANAGSGKTKVLIDRVARLLLQGAAPDSILCVTYTKAAANEMLQRLFGRLGSWSVMEEAELREELTELEGRSASSYSDEDIRSARALFARALETPGGLRIETIHAFCARVLRRFPLEADVAPGFTEIDEIEAEALWQDALTTGLAAADKNTPEALDHVAYTGGGLGAMAGLQIAKANAAHILKFADRFDNDPVLMDEALRSALKPPEQSEDQLLAEGMGSALPIQKLQEAAAILETDKADTSKKLAKSIRQLLKVESPEKRWQLYRPLFIVWDKKNKKEKLRDKMFVKAMRAQTLIPKLFETKEIPQGSEALRIKQLDADLKAARLFARTRALLILSTPILQQYRALKRERAAIDFDDLIARTHALLTRKTAADWVLYKLDGGLTHVLLDEAQDTSPEQWGLLNALTEEFFAGKGADKKQDPRTLFVVGDEKQSIYSFQGADPQKFLSERQSFQIKAQEAFGKAELPEMAMSFRSSPEILNFVDKVSECGDVDGHPYIAAPVAEANISRHTARRANQPGSVELWPITVPQPDENPIPWEAPKDTQSAASPKNQLARQVASEIAALLDRGDMVWTETKDRTWHLRPANAGDVLVLVNTRTGGLFDALIDALKAKSIPVAGADRLVLVDHIGVQDCLNLIRFVLLPSDDLTLAEILRGPFCNLVDDDKHLFPLAYERGETPLWTRLKTSTDAAHQPARAFLESLLENAHLPAYEFLSFVLTEPDTEGITGWERLAARLGAPMRDPVQALLSRAMVHDAQSATSLQRFVADMELDRTQIKRDLAASAGEVRVMTVHGAKGLQAPIVILPDTTSAPKAIKPSLVSINDAPAWIGAKDTDTEASMLAREDLTKRALREHRRLLYVALTRAQDRLMIFGAWAGQKPKTDSDKEPGDGFRKSSWYGLCAEAMAGLLGDLPMGDDNRPVFCRFGPAPQSIETDVRSNEGSDAMPAWLSKPAPSPQQSPKVTAPSALIPGETPIMPPLSADRMDRLKRGRLIHALLERLPALPAAEREAQGAAFLKRDTSLDDAAREDMLSAAMGVLNDPAFADVFAEGGRAEAPVIGTSSRLPEGVIINGRIDRLVVTATDVFIIDFKTDRPPPKRAEDVGWPYLAQMGAYAAVLAEAYPNHRIRAALAWTDGPKLMELPADLLAEAISHSSVAV